MTEPPNSGELETVSVESTAIYLMYEVKTIPTARSESKCWS